jgi:hypothetical protein
VPVAPECSPSPLQSPSYYRGHCNLVIRWPEKPPDEGPPVAVILPGPLQPPQTPHHDAVNWQRKLIIARNLEIASMMGRVANCRFVRGPARRKDQRLFVQFQQSLLVTHTPSQRYDRCLYETIGVYMIVDEGSTVAANHSRSLRVQHLSKPMIYTLKPPLPQHMNDQCG